MELTIGTLLQSRAFLEDLRHSLSTTANWWELLPMVVFSERRMIRFRGWSAGGPVGLSEYVKIRDLLAHSHLPSYEGGEVSVRLGKYSLVGGSRLGKVFHEIIYDAPYLRFNYNGKVVLDVGGFCGATAVLFYTLGARQVVVYEPMAENLLMIKENLRRNRLEAEVHEEGMGAAGGSARVRYNIAPVPFGPSVAGSRGRVVRVRGAEEIIRSSVADIAKIDCGGYESALLSVQNDVIRLIPKYIIETHSPETKEALIRKFRSASYEVKVFRGRAGSFRTLLCERRVQFKTS